MSVSKDLSGSFISDLSGSLITDVNFLYDIKYIILVTIKRNKFFCVDDEFTCNDNSTFSFKILNETYLKKDNPNDYWIK